MKKKIYTAFSVDILHEGHINILKSAAKYGEVIVGLLTDSAIASYKRLPHYAYKRRKFILENVKYVSKVVPQETLDYEKNLKKYKPHYVIHGDDWKTGVQKKIRERVIKILKGWGGKLIEVKYTKNISSEKFKKVIFSAGTTPEIRKSKLKRLIESKKIVRILEAHSPLSGLVIEKLNITKNNELLEFDGMWSSSLTDSALRGKPDNQSVEYSTRINWINEIFDVTTKPLIFDADNGGRVEHIKYIVSSLERIGGSSIIIEDKIGLKKNSLLGNEVFQEQDSIESFASKIKEVSRTKIHEEFMVIARIESLILEAGIDDAINRAFAYVEAGADGIMIHSRKKEADEIIAFCHIYNRLKERVPLVVVPSSYNKIFESELIDIGVNVVIYANHLLRSAYPSMRKTAISILENGRSLECDSEIMSIKEILNLIPGTK